MSRNTATPLSLLIFLFFTTLYLLTTNQNFSFDAVTNAIACEANEPARWFHSNHLFYPFLGVLYYKFEMALGYQGPSIYSLARLNSLLMSASLASLFFIFHSWIGKSKAFLMVLFLGFTYSVWHYAVDGRAIGMSVFFAVLVIGKLMSVVRREQLRGIDIGVLSALSSLYVLIHGIAIFHSAAIGYFVYQLAREKKELSLIRYFGLVFLMLGGLYAVVFLSLTPNPTFSSFLHWVLGYAAFGGTGNVFQSGFWGQELTGVIFGLLRGWAHAFIPPFSYWQKIFSFVISGMVVFCLILFYLNLHTKQKIRQVGVNSFLLWGGLTMVFLAFWSPGQEGFRLIVLIPWMSALVLVSPSYRGVNWFLGLGAAVMFHLNFTSVIFPAASIANNRGYQALREIRSHLKPNDLFLSLYGKTAPDIEVLRPYFFPEIRGGSIHGRLYAFRERNLDNLLERLSDINRNGFSLYFDEDIFDINLDASLEEKHGLPKGAMSDFRSRFRVVDHLQLDNGRRFFHVALN